MKIQITGGGIFNSAGEEIPVGTELDVKSEPAGWAGRYTVLKAATEGKVAVKNPKAEDPERDALEALKVDEVKKIADDEKVDLQGASAKGDMIEHILKARAAKKAA